MDTSDTIADLVDCLHRRRRIVAAIRAEPREKRALVDDLDVPRSTLDRAIRELETANAVAYAEGEYALTPLGEHLANAYFEYVERTEALVEAAPVVRWTTPDALDLDPRWLADAAVWTPEPTDPWAMVNRHVAALEAADRVRGILPLVGLHAVEMVHERVVEDGADHRIVVESGVAETLRTDDSYAPLYRDLRAGDEVTFAVYDGDIPFFVGVFDDEFVQIGVDEDREPRALLESDSDEVLSWARETIARYEQQAEPLGD